MAPFCVFFRSVKPYLLKPCLFIFLVFFFSFFFCAERQFGFPSCSGERVGEKGGGREPGARMQERMEEVGEKRGREGKWGWGG